MILTGTRGKWADGCRQYAEFGHNRYCPNTTGEDLKPGLSLLQEEYSIGKIIRLDEQTHNRLVEFAKPEELYTDLINRLLDITEAKNRQKFSPQGTKLNFITGCGASHNLVSHECYTEECK